MLLKQIPPRLSTLTQKKQCVFKGEYSLCHSATLVLHFSAHQGNAGWSPPVLCWPVSSRLRFRLYSISTMFSAVSRRLAYRGHKHNLWNCKHWRKNHWYMWKSNRNIIFAWFSYGHSDFIQCRNPSALQWTHYANTALESSSLVLLLPWVVFPIPSPPVPWGHHNHSCRCSDWYSGKITQEEKFSFKFSLVAWPGATSRIACSGAGGGEVTFPHGGDSLWQLIMFIEMWP